MKSNYSQRDIFAIMVEQTNGTTPTYPFRPP